MRSITGRPGWTPGGYALSFGRMLQDGIVKKYLDAHCPDATLRLCPYKDQLPRNADAFFWEDDLFIKLGRFDGLNDEMRRIALACLADYPMLQLKSVLTASATQLTMVETGAGVVRWVWDSYYSIKNHVPAALPAMDASRQHRVDIDFTGLNRLHVPVVYLAMALLPLIALLTLCRKGLSDIGELATVVMLALLGNAVVFGAFATAHNRYGARMVWLAPFVVMLRARTDASDPPWATCRINLDFAYNAGPGGNQTMTISILHTAMLAAVLTGGFSAAAMADVLKELAPTGKLRAAINLGNSVLAQKDEATGEPKGITPDLARELGRRLGVPVELIPYNAAGKVFDDAGSGNWDIAFVAIEPVRASVIEFSAPYVIIEGTYMVRSDSPLKTIADVDRPGVRIAVGPKSAYDLYLTRTIKNATIVRAPVGGGRAMIDMFINDKLEVAAGVKQPLVAYAKDHPDMRVMDGHFQEIQQAMGMPKGRPAGAAYLRTFVEEMKASGFVAEALKRSHQTATVAPAAK